MRFQKCYNNRTEKFHSSTQHDALKFWIKIKKKISVLLGGKKSAFSEAMKIIQKYDFSHAVAQMWSP